MNRSEARETAFLMVFEASFSETPDADSIIELACENMGYDVNDYCTGLVKGTVEKRAELVEIIDKYSTKWKTGRLSRVALSACEIAVYEIKFGEVPAAVAVNECVELIKKYDTEESAKYINGVLGGFVKDYVG